MDGTCVVLVVVVVVVVVEEGGGGAVVPVYLCVPYRSNIPDPVVRGSGGERWVDVS